MCVCVSYLLITITWRAISWSRPWSAESWPALYWRSQSAMQRQAARHGRIACLSLARQKNSNLDGETGEGERGANTVLWIVIFTGDHATMVLIITCELMQIQNTAPSHTQTSRSTQQGVFLVLLYLFKLKFVFRSEDCYLRWWWWW